MNRFTTRPQLKVIPQIGGADRARAGGCSTTRCGRPTGGRSRFGLRHIETYTAPRTLDRFQQRDAFSVFGGVNPGITKGGLTTFEKAQKRPAGPEIDYAGKSRQMRQEVGLPVTLGFAVILIYLVLAAQSRVSGTR